jgi:hypothetical protein
MGGDRQPHPRRDGGAPVSGSFTGTGDPIAATAPTAGSGKMYQNKVSSHLPGRGKGGVGFRTSVAGFVLLCVSMFLNLILAFLHARGFPVSANIVIAAQAAVTALALPAFLSRRTIFSTGAVAALGFIVLSTLATNILNPFAIRSVYDSILIPIYIALGMSASYVRPKWMHYLLLFVVVTALLEMFFPSLYLNLFDPGGYFSATREWVADQKANGASADGFYTGSYRSGGSQFSFADHRIGGAFLEPLSLGYFAVLMSTYYSGLYRGSLSFRVTGIVLCLCLTLASDSRVATGLVLLSTLLLTLRVRLPALILWSIFPIVIITIYTIYFAKFGFVYGDTFYRLGVTFDALASVNFGHLLAGMVPLERVGDSGVLHMLRCVGLVGMLVAVWFYSGAFTRQSGTNVTFFILIATYLTITLMFGMASLSIKTASLLGYLVGVAGQRGNDIRPKKFEILTVAPES